VWYEKFASFTYYHFPLRLFFYAPSHRAVALVSVKTPAFFTPPSMWPLNSPDLNLVTTRCGP